MDTVKKICGLNCLENEKFVRKHRQEECLEGDSDKPEKLTVKGMDGK
jgi:hypothetical protein